MCIKNPSTYERERVDGEDGWLTGEKTTTGRDGLPPQGRAATGTGRCGEWSAWGGINVAPAIGPPARQHAPRRRRHPTALASVVSIAVSPSHVEMDFSTPT
jgi:hypothetical protein